MKASLVLGVAAAACVSGSIVQGLQNRQSNWTIGQTVQTSSGPVNGHAARNGSEVSEYLGIPFAQAPIGNLRFAAPVKFTGNASLNGSDYGFSCPIQNSGPTTIPNATILAAANLTTATTSVLSLLSNSRGVYSEDCLNLNVWTKPQTGDAKKAVLVWIYGGGFNSGSSANAGYDGTNIADKEDVIVVSFNYRLSILGFPGNPSATNNLAFLDQRLAVEWVRDNIENFGGDPARITIFGQSAGGASVDFYSYAWKDDPIAAGFIAESGNAFSWGLPNAKNLSAGFWFNVTGTLGCGDANSNPDEVLSCMRRQNYTDILDSIPTLSATASILGGFGPTVDDTIVFSNYSASTPAAVPMLLGNNDYEAGLFRVQFSIRGIYFPDSFWDGLNLQAFTCPAGLRANASIAAQNPTWRYRYFGVFPNLAISTDAATWHAAEIPMIFNTAPLLPPSTEDQVSIADYMRKGWTTFAKDPVNGLTNYGWPQYDPSQDTLIRLAYDNITGPNLINPYRYDADCIFVNVSSTDTNPNNVPELPDLGATVTPTGNSSSPTATSTGINGAGTAPGTGSPTGTGSAPASTTTNSAGSKISSSNFVGLGAILAACLL